MNWLKGSNTLIVISITLLIFSCKVGDGDISSSVQPKSEVLSTFFQDSFSLQTSVVLYDTVITNTSERMLAGVFTDPVFGKLTLASFADFTPQNFKTFGPNPKLISTSLAISFTSTGINSIDNLAYRKPYYYGASSNTEKFYFYRLTANIDRNKKYTSLDSLPYSQLLGYSILNSQSDITFPIDTSLGHELVFTEGVFETNTRFQEQFKGIAIIPDKDNQSVWGFLSVNIKIVYENFYGFNNLLVRDSIFIPLSQATSSKFFNLKSDKSVSKISQLVQNYDSLSMNMTEKTCYIQSNSGVGTAIRFPFIENFKRSIKGKILVDRAEIIIKPEINVDSASQPPPPFIVLHELSSDGRIRKSNGTEVYLQNELNGIFGVTSPLLVGFDVQTGSYRIPVTTYLQSLIDGSKPNHGLLLKGTNEYRDGTNRNTGASISSFFGVINKAIFYNDKSKPYNISLRVHYTSFE